MFGALTNRLLITLLPAFLVGMLGTFGDANFGWLRLLLGWLSQKKLMEGNWVPPRWRGGLR